MSKKKSYTRAPPLACRDDLLGSLAHAWDMLEAGARDRSVPFHLPALATVDDEGQPHVRTVVLRDCNRGERWLRFNTDRRSPKVNHIRTNPKAALHFYDKFEKVQLRLRVRLEFIVAGGSMRSGMESTTTAECYQITELLGPRLSSRRTSRWTGTRLGRACPLHRHPCPRLVARLALPPHAHRRAQYGFADGPVQARWVVP